MELDEEPQPEPIEKIQLYVRSDQNTTTPTQGNAVVGLDIGTHYFAAVRTVRDAKTGRRIMTHAAVIDLRDDNGAQTIDVIANNIAVTLLDPVLHWIWYPLPGSKWPHYVCVERQVDHIKGIRGKRMKIVTDDQDKLKEVEDDDEKLKKEKYKPPIMFAIYGMLRVLANLIKRPLALLSNALFAILARAGIVMDTVGSPTMEFVPRSGSQKLGLKDLHGSARKEGRALNIGILFMEEEEDAEGANFVETLGRPKPLQDVNDAYLQAAHLMKELEDNEAKEKRKEEREAKQSSQSKRKYGPSSSANKRKRAEESDED